MESKKPPKPARRLLFSQEVLSATTTSLPLVTASVSPWSSPAFATSFTKEVWGVFEPELSPRHCGERRSTPCRQASSAGLERYRGCAADSPRRQRFLRLLRPRRWQREPLRIVTIHGDALARTRPQRRHQLRWNQRRGLGTGELP